MFVCKIKKHILQDGRLIFIHFTYFVKECVDSKQIQSI